MSLTFTIDLEPDDNCTILVTCPDLPEVTSFGESEADAIARARDGIEEAIAARIAEGRDIPRPRRKGAHRVSLTTQTSLKVALYRALKEENMTRAELMRRLGWRRESVDRLFRLDHASRLNQLDAAFRALGRDVEITVR